MAGQKSTFRLQNILKGNFTKHGTIKFSAKHGVAEAKKKKTNCSKCRNDRDVINDAAVTVRGSKQTMERAVG